MAASNAPPVSTVICKTQDLSMDQLQDMYRIWTLHVDTQYSVTDFKTKVISVFEDAYLFCDPIVKTIRGFYLATILRNRVFQGRKVTLIPSGVGFIEEEHRTVYSKVYHSCFTNMCLEEAMRDPSIHVYVLGRPFTYKGYLSAIHRLANNACFPRYDKETPIFEKRLIDDFRRKTQGELYDPNTGLIKMEEIGVKDGVSDIKEKHLSNPHIRFFVERNPDWKKGHMLCTIMRITPDTVLTVGSSEHEPSLSKL